MRCVPSGKNENGVEAATVIPIGTALSVATGGIAAVTGTIGTGRRTDVRIDIVATVTSEITVLGAEVAGEIEAKVVTDEDAANQGIEREDIETDLGISLASGRPDGRNTRERGTGPSEIFRWRLSRNCRI